MPFRFHPAILRICRAIYQEAIGVLYSMNTFSYDYITTTSDTDVMQAILQSDVGPYLHLIRHLQLHTYFDFEGSRPIKFFRQLLKHTERGQWHFTSLRIHAPLPQTHTIAGILIKLLEGGCVGRLESSMVPSCVLKPGDAGDHWPQSLHLPRDQSQEYISHAEVPGRGLIAWWLPPGTGQYIITLKPKFNWMNVRGTLCNVRDGKIGLLEYLMAEDSKYLFL